LVTVVLCASRLAPPPVLIPVLEGFCSQLAKLRAQAAPPQLLKIRMGAMQVTLCLQWDQVLELRPAMCSLGLVPPRTLAVVEVTSF